MSWSTGWLMLSVDCQFSSASAAICGVDLVRFFLQCLVFSSLAPALSGGRDHQADDANQPPECTKQEDARQQRDSSDQHDGGEPEHGFQQLLNAAKQIINGFAKQQHDVHLLGQLIQQDCDPCGSSQHQHDDRQLTQDGAIGEAATGAENPSLIMFAASARLPHGIGVIRVPSLRRF